MRRESQSDEKKALTAATEEVEDEEANTNTSATAKAGAADCGLGRSACSGSAGKTEVDVEQLGQGSP